MRDTNHIRTLEDYSKPSHEGYRNTIDLPVENIVVPLRSDTVWLVQNGCSFHRLRSKDPNQHLKDFLKLVDSLDLDCENRERTRLLKIFYDHVTPVTRRTIDQSAGGKLHDRNAEESWALLEDLSLYANESWNDPRHFTKPVKAISLPQDVPTTSDRCLIDLENQVQRLMEAHLAPMQPAQVNKITTSCEICSVPHDTQYYMENPKQAFVEYASSRTDEAGVLSAHSYPISDPQCSSRPSTSINAVKTCSKYASHSHISLLQTEMGIRTEQTEEPESTLEDEFHDLHLNLPVIECLAHALIYNAMLDKYMESLELGKNGSAFIQGEVSTKMEEPGYSLYPVD
uniref:Transposable element protein, putative n=1 Tax=Tanacetum cinerariifolium TaxID=118510 RepID=A0A6L2K967_TANCI|nr:transposable element protein, putative [Tanacetum cinerariifolium]